ncbi:macrophage metalloelastase-like [Branchiostoma floridae x Branchiostoma belcheri]
MKSFYVFCLAACLYGTLLVPSSAHPSPLHRGHGRHHHPHHDQDDLPPDAELIDFDEFFGVPVDPLSEEIEGMEDDGEKLETLSQQPKQFNTNDGRLYLQQFGYYNMSEDPTGMLGSLDTISPMMRRAVINFQQFANIPTTGVIDEKTAEMMKMPRCGCPDVVAPPSGPVARYTRLGSRWQKNDLTYRINNFTPDLPRDQVVDAIARAFDVWSEVTPLTFRRVSGPADIEIRFAAGSHGDGNAFDSRGGVLAHAYQPGGGIGGDAHFDESEVWQIGGPSIASLRGTDLFSVAAHEFGHSLGLGHSQVNSALMAPFYRYQSRLRLDRDDINGIQSLYGGPRPRPQPTPAPRPQPTKPPVNPPPPGGEGDADTCSGKSFDAFTRVANGTMYAFRGKYFWQLTERGVSPGYPQLIKDVWQGLPGNLDAAMFYEINGKTYFFKGGQFWRFTGDSMDSGYPRSISGWRTVSDIDAALYYGEWDGKTRTYFFKDGQYWRYTGGARAGADSGYPRSLSLWRGFPTRIDAAFTSADGSRYIFREDRYWKLAANRPAVDTNGGYPRSVATDFLGCAKTLQDLEIEP